MRHLLLALILTFFTSLAYAQINKSKSEVMQFMSNDNTWTFEKSARSNEGYEYLSYSIPTKVSSNGQVILSTKGFYFKNDSCKLIRLVKTNNQLNDVIKELNSKFTSVGNNIWYDVKENSTYEIKLTENSSVFWVDERPFKN